MELLQIYFFGIVILIFAIIFNFVAKVLKISTWYDFLLDIKEKGLIKSLSSQGILSLIFLFFVYPFLLGIVVYFILK